MSTWFRQARFRSAPHQPCGVPSNLWPLFTGTGLESVSRETSPASPPTSTLWGPGEQTSCLFCMAALQMPVATHLLSATPEALSYGSSYLSMWAPASVPRTPWFLCPESTSTYLQPSYGGIRGTEITQILSEPANAVSGETLQVVPVTLDDQRAHTWLKWADTLTALQGVQPKAVPSSHFSQEA